MPQGSRQGKYIENGGKCQWILGKWQSDFEKEYLENIKFCCLVFGRNYIEKNFDEIVKYANVIETRINDDYTKEMCLKDNMNILEKVKKYNVNHFLIDGKYDIESVL